MTGLSDLFILLNITKRLGRQTSEDDGPQTSRTCPRMWTLNVGYNCHLHPGLKRRPAVHKESRRQLSRSQSLSSSVVSRGGQPSSSSVIVTLVNGQFYAKVILGFFCFFFTITENKQLKKALLVAEDHVDMTNL